MEFKNSAATFIIAIMAACVISFAQNEPNPEIYNKVVTACEENKAVKTGLAQISKKNGKVVDVYDKSERGEKARFERSTSEIEIIKADGPKVLKSYADCMKSKLQAKEFRGNINKVTVKLSVTNEGNLVIHNTTTTERALPKGKKTSTVNAPKTTLGKSYWCEDEMKKCAQATIVVDQK
ncbi:MAG: hypothetical protein FWB90_05060 [Fibromonadales bacterium]|nr:hypothetical protein [Fibromonadales bacterium]